MKESGHGELVRKAVEALDGPELTIKVGALSTTVEGDIDDVLHAVARAHNDVVRGGVPRGRGRMEKAAMDRE